MIIGLGKPKKNLQGGPAGWRTRRANVLVVVLKPISGEFPQLRKASLFCPA